MERFKWTSEEFEAQDAGELLTFLGMEAIAQGVTDEKARSKARPARRR